MNKHELIDQAMEVARAMRPGEVRDSNALETLAWQVVQLERRLAQYGVPSPFPAERKRP